MIKQRILNKLRKVLLNILLLASVSFTTTSLQATENPNNYTSTYKDNKSLISDSRQVDCLVANTYHESRGESKQGQLAVIFTVLNRVKDSRFGNTPCKVIHSKDQFSWVGKGKVVKEKEKYKETKQLVLEVLSGKHRDPSQGALYFNSHHKRPANTKCVTRIGQHSFYR